MLEGLRNDREAVWQAFDWEAIDGWLCDQPTSLTPRPIVILEGAYAARAELADLIDLRVRLAVTDEARMARFLAREDTIGSWERQWHEAEDFYFRTVMPPEVFDVIYAAPAQLRERVEFGS